MFEHVPVLLEECMQALRVKPGGLYVDATLGGAGHSYEILRRSSPDGRLIGIDRDAAALQAAQARLSEFGDRARIVKGNFEDIVSIVEERQLGPADGILADLGVSSHQLDEADRGFSYQHDAPLDMRMDRSQALSAYDVVNTYGQKELADIIRKYGEERFAGRIASFIVRARGKNPIRTTDQLADIIKAAVPAANRRQGGHPARRTFQGIRIEVNDELGAIERLLENVLEIMKPGGRLAVITFHSLEDRIVKQTFQRLLHPCTCPREAPVCTCGKLPQIRLITRKPALASRTEVQMNPRSRSAKLRVAEKL
ncbi:MAG: 16S rRNA (cytosine(1402)-N(4))-methyltransferase RsmH [Christensenellales bacterium]